MEKDKSSKYAAQDRYRLVGVETYRQYAENNYEKNKHEKLR